MPAINAGAGIAGQGDRRRCDRRYDRWWCRHDPPGCRTATMNVALSCSFIYSTTPTADPAEVANGDCSNKAAVQDLQGHGTHVATTVAGADQRRRHRRRRPQRDDRRAQGVHHRRLLLRRFRGCRAALCRRPPPRRREPELVRRSVPVLLQQRCRAAGDAPGLLAAAQLCPAAGRGDRRRGREPGPGSGSPDHRRTSARTGRPTPPSSARSATTAASHRPSSPGSSRSRRGASPTSQATRPSATRSTSPPPAATLRRPPPPSSGAGDPGRLVKH